MNNTSRNLFLRCDCSRTEQDITIRYLKETPVLLVCKSGLRRSCVNIPQTQPPPQERKGKVSFKVRKRSNCRSSKYFVNYFLVSFCVLETQFND